MPLNETTIKFDCIFSVLFIDFNARSPISIPTLPIAALTEFFHADPETIVHSLPVSWYFMSSLWRYLCSCMHIISMWWTITEAVSSGSSISSLFKVLMLNDAICIVPLHLLLQSAPRVECLLMARETWVQSQVASYQRL